jgi:DNA-binding transcriptional MerR regulator
MAMTVQITPRALLDRLQLIKVLQREHWPLSRIREHLEELDEEGVRREARQQPELPASLSDSALKYTRALLGRDSHGREPVHFAAPLAGGFRPGGAETGRGSEKWQVTKSTWERIRLTNDVELSIRRPLTREQNKLVDRLLEAARKILAEED